MWMPKGKWGAIKTYWAPQTKQALMTFVKGNTYDGGTMLEYRTWRWRDAWIFCLMAAQCFNFARDSGAMLGVRMGCGHAAEK
jgi:hypothetical protein